MTGAPARRSGGSSLGRDLRRAVRRHRAWLAAALVAAAVAAGLTAVSPAPQRQTAVLVAARDIAAGAVVGRSDLAVERLPAGTVPDGALGRPADVAGRRVAGPVRRGEPITDVRLVGRDLLAGLRLAGGSAGAGSGTRADGWVAVPVRLTDAGAASVVTPGDRIDVLATPADGAGPATVVAPGVLVVATFSRGAYEGDGGSVGPLDAAGATGGSATGSAVDPGDGGLVVVATTTSVAAQLARAAVGEQLSPAVLPAPGGR